jgi:hypothetical protein
LLVHLAGSSNGFPPLKTRISKENIRNNRALYGSMSDLDEILTAPSTSAGVLPSYSKLFQTQSHRSSQELETVRQKLEQLKDENAGLQEKVTS